MMNFIDACKEGHLEIVKEILKAGVDVNMKGTHCWTALHYA